MKKRIKVLITIFIVFVLFISMTLQVGVSASRIPEVFTRNLRRYNSRYYCLDTQVFEELSFPEYGKNYRFLHPRPFLYLKQWPVKYILPDKGLSGTENITTQEFIDLYREWMWDNTHTKENINSLLYNDDVPAVIVEIADVHLTDYNMRTSWIQYTGDKEKISNDFLHGMVFRSVKIVDVLRNPQNDENLVVDNYIWLQESYFYNCENDIIYTEYGKYQKPMRDPGDQYLVFLDDLNAYSFIKEIEKSGDTFPGITVDDTNGNIMEPVAYDFDERYFWKIGDTALNSENYEWIIEEGLYADYREIQYGYYDKVMSHFGLLEGQDNTEQTDPPPTSGPNLAAIFVSIAILLALGALTYTVNETAKKNKNK